MALFHAGDRLCTVRFATDDPGSEGASTKNAAEKFIDWCAQPENDGAAIVALLPSWDFIEDLQALDAIYFPSPSMDGSREGA